VSTPDVIPYCRDTAARPPRSTYFCILPVAVLGSSSTKWKPRGALKWAMLSRGELAQLLLGCACPAFSTTKAFGASPQRSYGQAHHRDLLHRRVTQQDAFHLYRRDVLAAAD